MPKDDSPGRHRHSLAAVDVRLRAELPTPAHAPRQGESAGVVKAADASGFG